MNTWPGNRRHAMSQSEHEEWNSSNYPGTRQICFKCDEPTGLCEEDGNFDKNGDPYCDECWAEIYFKDEEYSDDN